MNKILVLLAFLIMPAGAYAMDVRCKPIKISDRGIFGSSCSIWVGGKLKKRVVVTQNQFGNTQETHTLFNVDGTVKSRSVHKSYHDVRPLTQFGQERLRAIIDYRKSLGGNLVDEEEQESSGLSPATQLELNRRVQRVSSTGRARDIVAPASGVASGMVPGRAPSGASEGVMDVQYFTIDEYADESVSLRCRISFDGIARKEIVVILDSLGRSQEVETLIDEEGNPLEEKVIKGYEDRRPLSQLGQDMLQDLKDFKEVRERQSDFGSERGAENSRLDSRRMSDFDLGANEGPQGSLTLSDSGESNGEGKVTK